MNEDELCRLRRESISTIFQFFHLLPTLTARENIEFPMQILGLDDKERAERLGALIDEVQLEHRANAMPDELSGGEQQRVAIARALAIRPDLILADEPTSSLDDENCDRVVKLLKEQAAATGASLIVVTHDQRLKDQFEKTVSL